MSNQRIQKLMEKSKRLKLPKTINIPAGIILDEGPSKVEFYEPVYECLIGIGKNGVARLFIQEQDLMELKKLEPEITIY